jgi:hypothetical protein
MWVSLEDLRYVRLPTPQIHGRLDKDVRCRNPINKLATVHSITYATFLPFNRGVFYLDTIPCYDTPRVSIERGRLWCQIHSMMIEHYDAAEKDDMMVMVLCCAGSLVHALDGLVAGTVFCEAFVCSK